MAETPLRPATAVFMILCGIMTANVVGPDSAAGQVNQEDALLLAFPPPAQWTRETAFLTEEQVDRARELAGSDIEIDQSVITYYLAVRDDALVGVAYFDAHQVRTKREVVMVVVTPDHRVERIEILLFLEPPEYKASDAWIDQLLDRPLGPGLSLKGDVINMTGATLTSAALTAAARRVLALHEVIQPFRERLP